MDYGDTSLNFKLTELEDYGDTSLNFKLTELDVRPVRRQINMDFLRPD